MKGSEKTLIVLGLWAAVLVSFPYLLVRFSGQSHLYSGFENYNPDHQFIRVIVISDGGPLGRSVNRIRVWFPMSDRVDSDFRYHFRSGKLEFFDEDQARLVPSPPPDRSFFREQIDLNYPDRDPETQAKLADDIVKLLEIAKRGAFEELPEWDVRLEFEEVASTPMPSGWNVVRPRYGGLAPILLGGRGGLWFLVAIGLEIFVAAWLTRCIVRVGARGKGHGASSE